MIKQSQIGNFVSLIRKLKRQAHEYGLGPYYWIHRRVRAEREDCNITLPYERNIRGRQPNHVYKTARAEVDARVLCDKSTNVDARRHLKKSMETGKSEGKAGEKNTALNCINYVNLTHTTRGLVLKSDGSSVKLHQNQQKMSKMPSVSDENQPPRNDRVLIKTSKKKFTHKSMNNSKSHIDTIARVPREKKKRFLNLHNTEIIHENREFSSVKQYGEQGSGFKNTTPMPGTPNETKQNWKINPWEEQDEGFQEEEPEFQN